MDIREMPGVDEAIAFVRDYNARRPHAPTAYVETFGCQQNEADSEKIRGMASAMGFAPTDDARHADLIVLNTCAIREHAEQKALSHLGTYKHIKEAHPDTVLALCGCMGAEAHRVEAIRRSRPYVDFTLSPGALPSFPVCVADALRKKGRHFEISSENPPVVEGMPCERAVTYRAWVSIMYGCNNFCSYCVVPYVRGRERSRMSADILREIEEVTSRGARDVTLLGQNVNSYRGDCDFPSLLEKCAALPGDFTLHFMTSHPKDLSDRLIDVIAENPKISRQFHLPVQSGSDRVLAAMNRRYTREGYLTLVRKLRAKIPDIVLTSDVIVGFPGETDDDFEATTSLLREVKYDAVYAFIYSPRVGTPAAKMENQVPEDVKHARIEKLLDVQREISLEANRAYVGRVVRVLADGASRTDKAYVASRTESGKLVHFPGTDVRPGERCTVRVTRADAFDLMGELLEHESQHEKEV